jgi:peptide/nickel transport system permease protein
MRAHPLFAAAPFRRVGGIRRFWKAHRLPPALPLLIVVVFLICAVFAGLLAPHPPNQGELAKRLLPPAGMQGSDFSHLLGTDGQGRDILSRLIYGSRITLLVSLLSIAVTAFIGTLVGLLAGFVGGKVDLVVMRLVDVSMSIPAILIAVLLAGIFGASIQNVVIVVIVLIWPAYARLIRGETLSVKQADFVALARVAGCSRLTIIRRHILPNVLPTVLVLASLHIALVIVMEAGLSFLGFGIPPTYATWGSMIQQGYQSLQTSWWVAVFPCVAVILVVISFNILGDWVRDRLDPKLRQV